MYLSKCLATWQWYICPGHSGTARARIPERAWIHGKLFQHGGTQVSGETPSVSHHERRGRTNTWIMDDESFICSRLTCKSGENYAARFFISHKSHFNLIDNGWRELNFTCKGTHPDFGSMSMKSCWCVRGTNFTQVPLSTFSIALCISLDSMSAVHLKIWAEQTGRILTICEHSLITFLWILKVFYFMY